MSGLRLASDPRRACVGLGLRSEIHASVLDALDGRGADGTVQGEGQPRTEAERTSDLAARVDFFEVAPENYMRRGGYLPHVLERVAARFPLLSHGLTMSFGGTDPFDAAYMSELRAFVGRFGFPFHSDHLCFASGGGRVFHDLFPLPLLRATVENAVRRIREVRDRLGVPVAIENISYYLTPGAPELTEVEMISRILEEADAKLLLDVNNVYVNATNHGFDARTFIGALPLERVAQIHVAGHEFRPAHGFIIDSHGADVIDPVLELLAWTIEKIGSVPVLLERDNAVPPLPALLSEVDRVRAAVERGLSAREAA